MEVTTLFFMLISLHNVSNSFKLKLICYGKVSEEAQIKDMLRKKNFREAISFVQELENEGEMTKEMISFVHAQVGFLLLFDLHFKEAVDHFLLSENMQPSELFPFILRDPNRWTLLVRANCFAWCNLVFHLSLGIYMRQSVTWAVFYRYLPRLM